MNTSSFYSRLRSIKKESLENRAPRPQPLTERKTPSAAKKKRLVQKKAAATLYRGVFEERQTVVDLRPALEKRDAENEALKQQLRVCKAKMDALRRKLRVCRKANTDLQATQKALVETNSSVVAQLKEAHSTRWNCAHTSTPDFRTPIRCTASGDAESREMSSATASVTSCHPEFAFTPPSTELLETLMIQSRGRPDQLGCLLFRTVVPQAVYEEWASRTNRDGSRGKRGLPENLRHFLMATVSQKFPFLSSVDSKRVKDRVNKFLHSQRITVAH